VRAIADSDKHATRSALSASSVTGVNKSTLYKNTANRYKSRLDGRVKAIVGK
jgi:ribosomal protein S20